MSDEVSNPYSAAALEAEALRREALLPPRAHRMPQLAGVLAKLKLASFTAHTLGGDEIYRLPIGGVAILTGAPGTGKTSLALGIAMEHAVHRGPVLFVSLEMDAHELAARVVGMQCDASWEEALTGCVSGPRLDEALAPLERLAVLDDEILQRHKNLSEALAAEVARLQEEYEGLPVLVLVDYLQIVPDGKEHEMRARVAETAQMVRRAAKRLKVIMLAISQPSRQAGKALSSSDLMGADTMTAMAESAEIERSAYITLALGAAGPDSEDGSKLVDMNIGKGRFGGGDTVRPLRFWGRSGLMRAAGEARPAAEVRAERQADKKDGKLHKNAAIAVHAVVAKLEESSGPMTSNDVCKALGGDRTTMLAAIRLGIVEGRIVRVRARGVRGGKPMWTPGRAQVAGLEIVRSDVAKTEVDHGE
jgi:KaiC/GvpD/RAD55 family RecA-like ATPase